MHAYTLGPDVHLSAAWLPNTGGERESSTRLQPTCTALENSEHTPTQSEYNRVKGRSHSVEENTRSPHITYICILHSYKRVKGRSHTVEERISMHSHKPHATSQPSLLSPSPTARRELCGQLETFPSSSRRYKQSKLALIMAGRWGSHEGRTSVHGDE